MFLTNKHMSRRTVLRGVGATVALPFLEAMVPARKAWAKTNTDRTRLVCIEMVQVRMDGRTLSRVTRRAGVPETLRGGAPGHFR